MNAETGDDHVSFSAAKLQASPSHRHLLMCTPEGAMRVFVLPIQLRDTTLQLLARIDSVQADKFFMPCACWHASGGLVLAACAAGLVQVCQAKGCLPCIAQMRTTTHWHKQRSCLPEACMCCCSSYVTLEAYLVVSSNQGVEL